MLPLFPVAVPAAPSSTRNNLDVALARRVGPLLGVYDVNSPFARSWVVDMRRVLLKELAQGYPDPVDPAVAPVSATGETKLAPTTVNRFGPDARAALVLDAVNTLLRDDVGHICAVLQFDLDRMHAVGIEPSRSLISRALALWATAVGEIWASYPVLVWAGAWARAAQRAADYDVRSAPRMMAAAAPGEYGYSPRKQFDVAPVGLGLIDEVIDWLRSARYTADGTRVVDRSDAQWLEDAPQNLAAVLAEAAQQEGDQPGVVWIPPLPVNDERVATAYVVPFQIVRDFARRQHLDPVDCAQSLQTFRAAAGETLAEAVGSLPARSFAFYLRATDVLAEWASRNDAGTARLAVGEHAELQELLLEASIASQAAHRNDPSVSWEAIVRFAELRAAACRLRTSAAAPEDELTAAADLVVVQLDELVAWTAARRGPTGPALAQLSRATSDLFDALGTAGGSRDAAWARIHAKIGEYWQFYRSMLAEGIAEDSAQGAIDHYLGNMAGYLAAVDLAPLTANREAMLTQALDLLLSRIIPYRRRRADRRPDWEDFLARAYIRAAQCAIELAESGADGEVLRNALLVRSMLTEARGLLEGGRRQSDPDSARSLLVIEELEAHASTILSPVGATAR